jgi:hypothetical protein
MKINSVQEFVDLCEKPGEGTDPYRVEASEEVWLLIVDQCPDLRNTVAGNKTIGERVIRLLANDQNEDVRWTIATKRRTPPDVLADLVHDSEPTVRKRVALNPKVPEYVLVDLLDDDWEDVREIAAERLRKLREEKDSSI